MKKKTILTGGGALFGALLASSTAFAAGALPAAGATPIALPALATPAAPASAMPALPAVNPSSAQSAASATQADQNAALPGLEEASARSSAKPSNIRPIRGPGNIPVQIPISIPPVLDSPTTKAQRRS